MLIGIYKSVTILIVLIIYYIMDIWLMHHYNQLRSSAKGTSRSWPKTIAYMITGVFAIVQPAMWPQLGIHTDAWWGLLTQAVGLTLILGALALNFWGRLHLGQFYSEWTEYQPGQYLVDTGPYAYVRHPLFIAYLTLSIGMLLVNPALPTTLAVAYSILAFALAARREEKLLSRKLPGYADYMVRTPRFLPRLGGRSRGQVMNLETFQALPTEEVARLVRKAGPKVCAFPINGTRRWFMLEHPEQTKPSWEAYLQVGGQRHIELYKMFFDHGIDTLLAPVFGPDLLEERGEAYSKIAVQGLLRLAQDQDFLDFYDEYDVRVRIYGDAQRYLQDTPYACTLEAFKDLAQRTRPHNRHRLFFGICAHDAAETVAEIGARYHQEYGHLPSKRQIVEAYYGEYVESVDFFIGFDKFTAFDMPLVATGSEDLYFTVSPSLYLDVYTLRTILYDHLYTRLGEPDYEKLTIEDWNDMHRFYQLNQRVVMGVGVRSTRGKIWYPIGKVQLPDFAIH